MYRYLLISLYLFFGLYLSGCQNQEPILIGFAGELTGATSELGVHGRNGVVLALEHSNEAGGINGRSLQLVIQDDLGVPSGAIAADEVLIEAGVVAIIGHMTSNQTLAGYPITEAANMVLLSPTSTTPELGNRDDHFFRIVPTHLDQAAAIAHHIYEDHQITRLAGIYDSDNFAYSQSYWQAFTAVYQQLGGQITDTAVYQASAKPDFTPLLADLSTDDPQGLFIIASAIDTALIAQQTRQQNWQVPLFSSAWAQTDTLIQSGGLAVEGLETVIAFDTNSTAPAYQEFAAQYQARFGIAPTFAAGEAYEAALILLRALENTKGSADSLAQALLNTKNSPGLISNISLNEFGDVIRDNFILVVQDGEFVTQLSIPPMP
jgi:branched-chain amino acid transport system substrate-binding protein